MNVINDPNKINLDYGISKAKEMAQLYNGDINSLLKNNPQIAALMSPSKTMETVAKELYRQNGLDIEKDFLNKIKT